MNQTIKRPTNRMRCSSRPPGCTSATKIRIIRPFLMGNYMLGGGFLNSRLATRIRVKEGLSYGVGSSLSLKSIEENGEFQRSP